MPQPATYITILREPIERLISFYDFVKQREHHNKHLLLKDAGFEAIAQKQAVPDNQLTRRLAGVPRGADAEVVATTVLLEQAKSNLEQHFSCFGLTSRYDESLIFMKRTFGWKTPYYVRSNVAIRKTDHGAISEQAIAIVEDYFAFDIELYTWASQRFDEIIAGQDADFQSEVERFRHRNQLYQKPATLARRILRRVRRWRRH